MGDREVDSRCFWACSVVRSYAGLHISPKQDKGAISKCLCGVRQQKINNETIYQNYNSAGEFKEHQQPSRALIARQIIQPEFQQAIKPLTAKRGMKTSGVLQAGVVSMPPLTREAGGKVEWVLCVISLLEDPLPYLPLP